MSDANLTTASAGELLKVGPTRIRVLEDGSRTDNRIGAIASLLPAGVSGPRQHRHLMHDETFLITSGILRFTLGDTHRDANVGDYVVVPVGTPPTFANVSDEPVDGVPLANGPTVSMFLKNRLTGWPCVCLLSLELEAFSGTIVETTHENRERIAKIYMIKTSYFLQGYGFRRSTEIMPAWDEQFAIAYAGKVREIEEWFTHHPGVAIDTFEKTTGLTLLHIAIGRNNLELTRFLLANGATIMPDERGRWPSLIAAACGVSDELYDLVADAELAAEEKAQDV